MKYFKLLALNVVVFIALRYMAILIAFLIGMTAADNYENFKYVLLFLLISQILFVVITRKKTIPLVYYIVTGLILAALYLGSITELIPSYIIPY